MSAISTTRFRRVDDKIAAVLAIAGILAAVPAGWYTGTAFSIAATAMWASAIWIFRKSVTLWTRAAITLTVIGFLLQLIIGVALTPAAAVSPNPSTPMPGHSARAHPAP